MPGRTLLTDAKESSGTKEQVYSSEQERLSAMMTAAASKAPKEWGLQPYVEKAAPIIAQILVMCQMAAPYVYMAYVKMIELLSLLDEDLWYALTGFVMCFFGGMYPLLIAAYEAFHLTGGEDVRDAVKELADEAKMVYAANKKDDKVDADNDGIADVNQMDAQHLMMRKANMFLVTADPEKINKALTGLYTGWVGVLASLKIQFAKTIALGAAIGNILRKPAVKFVQPAMQSVCPTEYHKWIPQVINYTCKAIAISIAWTIQRVISAVHSAIRGGLMLSRGLMRYATKNKLLTDYISMDEEESYLDEITGWSLALCGFWFQFQLGFSLPFILRYTVFLPLNIAESYLMWVVQE